MADKTKKFIMASAARTATENSATQSSKDANGGQFIIDVTADPAAASVVPHIQALDPASGKWFDLLVGAAITATGTTVLRVFPGADAIANLVANDILGIDWRVRMVHADTDSITYSVGFIGAEI